MMPIKVRDEQEDGCAWGVSWLVRAPYAHPVWNEYMVLLYDLTTPVGEVPEICLDGATHELMVFALDPGDPIDWMSESWNGWPARIEPALQCFQFRAESDEAARARIDGLAREIATGNLNPDRSYEELWGSIFADGVSLRRDEVVRIRRVDPRDLMGTGG